MDVTTTLQRAIFEARPGQPRVEPLRVPEARPKRERRSSYQAARRALREIDRLCRLLGRF